MIYRDVSTIIIFQDVDVDFEYTCKDQFLAIVKGEIVRGRERKENGIQKKQF